jgi:hypothetical protein
MIGVGRVSGAAGGADGCGIAAVTTGSGGSAQADRAEAASKARLREKRARISRAACEISGTGEVPGDLFRVGYLSWRPFRSEAIKGDSARP